MIGFGPSTRPARRRLARRLCVAAVAAGLIVGAAAPAAHAGASYKQGCFVVTPTTGYTTQTVYAYNTCSYTTGFQVYTNWPGFGTRSEGCVKVAPRTTGGWKWTKGRKFVGTGLC